jgi:hypothetical protein
MEEINETYAMNLDTMPVLERSSGAVNGGNKNPNE